jgi:hypothetical protein
MSEQVIDKATLLRNAAQNKRDKAAKGQVKKETLLAKVATFLNDDAMDFVAVSDMFPNGYANSAIVARFRTVIIENKLDELCYPIEMDGEVYVTKLSNETDAN